MNDAIWPTWIYTEIVKEHKNIYNEFEPFLDNPEYLSKPWTFGNCQSSIRSGKNDALPWAMFFETISPYINDHLQQLQPTMPYEIHTDEFWVNTYTKGEF